MDMARFFVINANRYQGLVCGQLGDTFLSSKHLDYMAATAEVSRP